MWSVRAGPAMAAALALVPGLALAQHEHAHEAPDKFGQIHFPTSCKSDVQPTFELAVAMLHSFAYAKAATTFQEISAKDPGCGLAQWGVAMTYLHIIWAPPTEEEFTAGRAAAQKAAAIGAPTPRERDYIAAIGTYYEGDAIAHPARVVAYEKAMAGVAQRSPKDDEAQIFHALALLGVAYNSPPDKTYARQKEAAKTLNRLLAVEPDHPGIAHYMIHSFDYPELAELALPAARAYAKIAPAAPHALHMPSHIFTRLGMWNESVETNLASQRTAQAWIAKTRPGSTAFDALHAMDYLEYAYLQTGQDAKARAVSEDAASVTSLDVPQFAAAYALAAIPARHALERRAWKEAAAVKLATAVPWAKYPYAEAIVHYARSIGSARAGDLETARQELTTLAAIQSALKGQKGFDWATQVEIERRAAAAWLARAEKKDAEALELMRSAADLEDSTDKHPVTPGSILPAREQLADLLAELGQPEAALAQYEISLRSAPARLNSFSVAAQAAERAGKKEEAKAYRDRLVALCGGTLPPRAALGAAAPARGALDSQKREFVVELDPNTPVKPGITGGVRNVEDFSAADKTYAVFEADSAEALAKYLEHTGMPAKKVTAVKDINSPARGGGKPAGDQPRAGQKTFVIERKIPGVGTFPEERKQAISKKSNAAIAQIGDSIEWVHSYLTDDGTYCVYRAKDEDTIHKHGAITGSPITKVSEAQAVISSR